MPEEMSAARIKGCGTAQKHAAHTAFQGLNFRLMAGSPSSAGTSATPSHGHQLRSPRSSQLKWAVGGCLGRELLVTDHQCLQAECRQTGSPSLSFESRQPGMWDRACQQVWQVTETCHSLKHPAGILGALLKRGFHCWSILYPLLLPACPSPPSLPPFVATLHPTCSPRQIGQT